jgi:hypothetical protein
MKDGSVMRVFTGLAFSLSLALACFGQSNAGSLAGTVTDPGGNAIANARVIATNVGTGQTKTTTTESTGAYRFSVLQVGTYSVSAAASGFKTTDRSGVQIQLETTTALDISLEVGATSETVEVSANAPQLQTESSDVGTVVTPEQVVDLPLDTNGSAIRNASDFVFLTPATYGTGTAGGNFQAGVGGGQTMGSEILLDGASIELQSFGDVFETNELPSVESIGEFKVLTSGIPANEGRSTSGVQSYTTKSGSNAWHGSGFEILHRTSFDANTWFNNLSIAENGPSVFNATPSDNKNEFGLSLDGPVRLPHVYNGKDRTFFFFSWGQFRQDKGYSYLETIPTQANLSGDFSADLTTNALGANPCDGSTIYEGQIFDPTTTNSTISATNPTGIPCRTAFAGNKITLPLSPVAMAIAQYIPAPTTSGLVNNYNAAGTLPIIDTAETIRIDHSFGEKDKIFAVYNVRDDVTTYTQGHLWLPVRPYITKQDIPDHFARVGYDHIFSSHLINHALLATNETRDAQNYLTVFGGVDYSQKVGLPGGEGDEFPGIYPNEGSVVPFGDVQNNAGYNGRIMDSAAILADNVLWSKGRHNLTLGSEYRYLLSVSSFTSPLQGQFQFGREQTAATVATASASGNGVASFLLGQVASVQSIRDLVSLRNLGHYFAGYIQDEFKVNRQLNLSLGLRYDFEVPFREEHDFGSNFSPTTINTGIYGTGTPGALIFGGSGSQQSGSTRWQHTYWRDIEPRLGFAWSPALLHDRLAFQGSYSEITAPFVYWQQEYSLPPGFAPTVTTNNNCNPFGAGELLDPGSPVTPGVCNATAYGVPSTPTTPDFDRSQLNGSQIYWAQAGFGRPGENQLWSLTSETRLATDLLLTIGYLGQAGSHLGSNLAYVNDLNPRYFSLGTHLNDTFSNATNYLDGVASPYSGFSGTVAQALRLYPQYTYINTAAYGENIGHNSFHSMIVKLERRFHNGLNLLGSYTWSKNLTDVAGIAGGSLGGDFVGATQNPFNLKTEKALGQEDVPSIFVLSYIYELPFGKGKQLLNQGRAADLVFGGWSLSGIQRYQDGNPVGFGCATSIPGMYVNQEGATHCVRWNLVSGQAIHSSARGNGHFNPAVSGDNVWYNPGAFSDPNANVTGSTPYSFGDKPDFQGNDRSFPWYEEDFGLTKRLPVTERINALVRVELFNAFNRNIFGNPDSEPYDGAAFGTVGGSQNSPRAMQLTFRMTF